MSPTLHQQILRPRCPQCGKGKLFKDMLGIVDQCSACGLVLKHHDAADAPAFFALTIIGTLVTAGAALVEIYFKPAMWVHAALWIPFTLFGSLLVLRITKTIFITMEHRLSLLKKEDPNA